MLSEKEKEAAERIEKWLKTILDKISNGGKLTREEKIFLNMLVDIHKKNYLPPYEY